MDWVMTYSGGKLDIEADNPNIFVRDIAHGLSLVCRFGGQCREFYSVGLHSIYLSDIVFNEIGKSNYAIVALFHDAAEVIFGDIPFPVKENLPDYKKYHDIFLRNIFKKFDLNYFLLKDIEMLDRMLCLTEAEYLDLDTSDWEHRRKYSPYIKNLINIRNPLDVEDLFMEKYYAYK